MRSRSYDPAECLAEVMQSETYEIKVDCKSEELTQGQHLVIVMMNTSLEKDSLASSVLRVYYEPPTSSTSEVELRSSFSWSQFS